MFRKVLIISLLSIVLGALSITLQIALGQDFHISFFYGMGIAVIAFILSWLLHNWQNRYSPQVVYAAFIGLVIGMIFLLVMLGITKLLLPIRLTNLVPFLVLFGGVFLYFSAFLATKVLFTAKHPAFPKAADLKPSSRSNKDLALPVEVQGKVLDTSVIIDGRILDIAKTNFLEGPIIIPNFVLKEIQLISDSPDPIKRARGRRGLDMLNRMKNSPEIDIQFTYKDYPEIRKVDDKLVAFCREYGYKLITNDFNLNKVAEIQGIEVLNLHNLANSLKLIVLPGEEFKIQVIREGKDDNQGIGYLEDGTMVVIKNGKNLVGKEITVEVTSTIQTTAGKMIFTKVKEAESENKKPSSGGGQKQSKTTSKTFAKLKGKHI